MMTNHTNKKANVAQPGQPDLSLQVVIYGGGVGLVSPTIVQEEELRPVATSLPRTAHS
jgi:hypothetical protein